MNLFIKSSLFSVFLLLFSFGKETIQSTTPAPEVTIQDGQENIMVDADCHCDLTINTFTLPPNVITGYQVFANGKRILISSATPMTTDFFIPRNGGSMLEFRVSTLDLENQFPQSSINYTLNCVPVDHSDDFQVFNRTAVINSGNVEAPALKWWGATPQCEISTIE